VEIARGVNEGLGNRLKIGKTLSITTPTSRKDHREGITTSLAEVGIGKRKKKKEWE